MSINEERKYFEFLTIIKKRVEHHNQIFTVNKQKLLKVLFDSKQHLSFSEIENKLPSISRTTLNRVISSFESLGVVESLIIDDVKRYELTYFKQPHYHLYCQECHHICEFENEEIYVMFQKQLKKMNFQSTSFNVIINGVCKKCQN